jgi:TRAP-type C4-dicarboxylate transport system permease small subunit
MRSIEPVIAEISRWMARIGGFLLLGAALLVSVEVIGRSTRLYVISLGTELSSYILAVAATWSLAYIVFERAHVRVDFVAQRAPPGPRAVLDLLALVSLAVVGAVLTYGAGEMLLTSLRLGSRSNTTLGMPLAIPHGLWAFGLLWFTAISIFRFAQALPAALRRDYAEVSRIGSSPSTDDEVEDAISETTERLGEGARP